MDRDFEKFNGGPTKPPNERIHVTINRRNTILMNQNCYRLIGKPYAVYLYYSRVKDVIAVEPLHNPRLPAAFPVKEKNSAGWRIQAGPFFKHFGIRVDTTERFIAPDIRDGKLMLKLSETVTVNRLRTKAKK